MPEFDDQFVDSLDQDPKSALKQTIAAYNTFRASHMKHAIQPDVYRTFVSAYALLEMLVQRVPEWPMRLGKLQPAKIAARDADVIKDISAAFRQIDRQIRTEESGSLYESMRQQFGNKLGVSFCYEFTEGDLKKIQALINELRDEIGNSDLFKDNESHRDRILRRLEQLQQELHKKMSNLDRFWGFMGEAGVMIGKFGKDAKPFVDRIRELAEITWRTQAQAEQLESGHALPGLNQLTLNDTGEDE